MRFRVLGPLEVYDGERRVEIGAAKLRGLLALLLIKANEPCARDRLIEDLWDGEPPASAAATLQSCVYRLRRLLADGRTGRTPVQTLPDGYRLDVSGEGLDTLHFEQLAELGRQALRSGQVDLAVTRLRAGIELWRGDAFSGIGLRVVRDRADVLDNARLEIAEECAAAELTLGRHSALVAELEDLTAGYPLRERLWDLLLRALHGSGRRTDALAAYQRLVRVLHDELGVEPAESVRDLHLQILHGDSVLDPLRAVGGHPRVPMPAQLPAGISQLAGRADSLRQLDSQLAGIDAPAVAGITAIVGPAGIGKTALAVHWAHRNVDRFPDGQLYMNLRGFDPSGTAMVPADALRRFLEVLGVQPDRIPSDPEARAGSYRSLLAGRRMLVLLDNARDADQVRPLLPGTPGCLTIVTSRDQLTSLVAAEGVDPLVLDLLTAAEARELLVGRLGPDRIAAEPDAVADFVDLCSGLPLALAIVAARAAVQSHHSLESLAGQLRESGGILDEFNLGSATTSLRAVFSWSNHALGVDAARMFRLLGRYPGPDFGVPAAASVVGLPIRRSRTLVAELHRAHLVLEPAPGRYTMHDLVRVYAAELASADDEGDAAVRRLVSWSVHSTLNARVKAEPFRPLIESAEPSGGVIPAIFDDDQSATRWCSTEQPNLVAIVHLATELGLHDAVCHLVFALTTFLQRRHEAGQAIVLQRLALQSARASGDKVAEGLARNQLGISYGRLGEYEEALVSLKRAQELFVTSDHPAGECLAAGNRGLMARRAGRPIEALEHLGRALELACAGGDENEVGWLLNNHAMVALDLGRPTDAERAARQAAEIHHRTEDRYLELCAIDTVGMACSAQHRHSEAVSWFRKACRLSQELGDHWSEAESLRQIGASLLALGEHDAARAAVQRASAIVDELGASDTTTTSRADLQSLLTAIDTVT